MDAAEIDAGPEARALLTMRRWLFVVSGACLGAGLLGFAAVHWAGLSGAERTLLGAALLCTGAGGFGSRRPALLWSSVLGLFLVVACAVLPGHGAVPWIPLGLVSSYLAYYAVILLPHRWGPAAAVATATLLAVVWAGRPGNVIPGGLAAMGGWASVLSVLVAALSLWWAWNHLLREAAAADARFGAAERGAAAALMMQERLALWRETAARVHESVLNTIRYVLTAPEVDRARLADELRTSASEPTAAAQVDLHDVTEVMDAVAADRVAGAAVRSLGGVPSVALEPRVAEALRAALVELARNAIRHGGASSISVRVSRQADGLLRCELDHDGQPAPASSAPGLGIGTVLEGALADAGGRWSRGNGTRTIVEVPPRLLSSRDPSTPTFDRGRLLVTAPIAGVVATGSLFLASLAWNGTAVERLAAAAGLIAAFQCVRVVRARRRLDTVQSIVALVAPSLVPWLLLSHRTGCTDIDLLAPVLNMSGLAVVSAATWSPTLAAVAGTLVWSSGGALLVLGFPTACQPSATVALLSTLVSAPLIIAVSSSGAHAYERAQQRAREVRHREFVERSRAAATADVNANLHGAVRDALESLERIVGGHAVDAVERRTLELADGRIRAALQVDPSTAGAMANLARRVVDRLAATSRPVQVRALASSADSRPIPLQVEALLVRAGRVHGEAHPQLHAFTDGVEDYLSLLVPLSALTAVGLQPGSSLDIDDVRIEVDEEADERGRVAILASRAILVAVVPAAEWVG